LIAKKLLVKTSLAWKQDKIITKIPKKRHTSFRKFFGFLIQNAKNSKISDLPVVSNEAINEFAILKLSVCRVNKLSST
jgi:RIO-like serine/threonine protein kinase